MSKVQNVFLIGAKSLATATSNHVVGLINGFQHSSFLGKGLGTAGVMTAKMEYAKKCNADLLLATDPDCDRVGIAVKNAAGEYVLLSGNETGMLLLNYVCERRIAMGTMSIRFIRHTS